MKKKKVLNISKAIKRPGALSKKAAKAGMTINAYAKAHAKDGNTLTGRQARFYLNTLKPLHNKSKD